MKKILNHRNLTFLFALIFMCFLQPQLSWSESTKNKSLQVAQQLHKHLGDLSSLSFQFSQRTMSQMSGRARQASGQAFFFKDKNSAKMRWDYQAPDRQIIISDGKELSMYFENLNQMIIAPTDSLQQDVTYSFFTSQKNIEESFLINDGFTGDENNDELKQFEIIKLTPKNPNSQVKSIRMWITEISQIKRIEIQDAFDTITLLTISNINENGLTVDGKLIKQTFFDFTPPEGTEIIRQ